MDWYRPETVDYQFVTDQLAVGGAIWTPENMREIARAGITHVVNLQMEFDDNSINDGTGICVLWNGCDDDFLPKPPEFFWKGVQFALEALANQRAKVLFHCVAGVHRSPFLLLSVLRVLGYDLEEAIGMIRAARPQADFPLVYLESVEDFVRQYKAGKPSDGKAAAGNGDSDFPQASQADSEV
ncbi:MAG: dual specificity protein phosphatase family protein [Acidobacteria bacterium]|nr:dual specificity protein phosphatase family protein [Acidobacteriota bacterium]